MNRARLVQKLSPERVPSSRLRDISDGYRVATDALMTAAELGCDAPIYEALWEIVQREADRATQTDGGR